MLIYNTKPEIGRVITGQDIIDWIKKNGLENCHIEFNDDGAFACADDIVEGKDSTNCDTVEWQIRKDDRGPKERIIRQIDWNEEEEKFNQEIEEVVF